MHVDKCQFKLSTKKPHTDSLVIQGTISVSDTSIDIASDDIVVTWGRYEVTLPANALYRLGNKRAFKYKKPKGSDISVAGAIFDLEKCVYKIIIKKAAIGSQGNTVNFGIKFSNFNQNITLALSQKKAGYFVYP